MATDIAPHTSNSLLDGINSREVVIHQSVELEPYIQLSYDVVIYLPPFNCLDKGQPFKYEAQRDQPYINLMTGVLDKLVPALKPNGSIYVYNIPRWLPYVAQHLSELKLTFKYWFAIKNNTDAIITPTTLKPTHEGALLYVCNKKRFTINTVRHKHWHCRICTDYLADWGGKKDQRNPAGYVVSDVWDDLSETQPPVEAAVERMLLLSCGEGSNALIVRQLT